MPTPRFAAEYWDTAADSFDQEADHGLRDRQTRSAWARLLRSWLPAPPAAVLDLGCGTGSLALLLTQHGHHVLGIDLSTRMAQLAHAKLATAGVDAQVLVGDAGDPPVHGQTFDVVLARHLLWTLPAPDSALRRWVELLRPGGRLVLVEGRWAAQPYAAGADAMPWTGGVTAEVLTAALRPMVSSFRVEPLTDSVLWGHAITDERYAIIAVP
jgi:SAM-dependent methyltransferase